MQLQRTFFLFGLTWPNVHELWFLHVFIDFILYFCVKNRMNFNVVIVSFLPLDHCNDPDLLVFAVSCLLFSDSNRTQLSFNFSVPFYILTCGIVLYCGTLLLWVLGHTLFLWLNVHFLRKHTRYIFYLWYIST